MVLKSIVQPDIWHGLTCTKFSNPLGNAVRVSDGKTDFLEALADWLEKWHDDCPAFTLTSKTSYALVLTLRAQSGLIKELLSEGYDFVMTSRLQSDPIERRFSQYRQMSGGKFLVSLREVTNSERIIRCRSLVKADINFWKEDFGSDKPSLDFSALLALLSEHEIEIAESTLDSSSEEVSTTIAGYIAKKLAKRSNCDSCKSLLIASLMDLAENHYLNLLSRGGLIVPPANLAEYTSHCFAIMDYSYNIVQAHGIRDVRAAYTQILLLQGKPPLPHKTQKNNTILHCQGAPADEISLLKGFLHNCGRAGISFRQLKKTKQDNRMYVTFPKSQKNT